jgi:hypothetical protein
MGGANLPAIGGLAVNWRPRSPLENKPGGSPQIRAAAKCLKKEVIRLCSCRSAGAYFLAENGCFLPEL